MALTALKVSKYGVFSGSQFPIFGLNTGKYGAEKKLRIWALFTQWVNCNLFLYADDTCLVFQSDNGTDIEKQLILDFENICDWFVDNKQVFISESIN